MIIDLELIYKKIIYVLVRKHHKIRLRKAEIDTIVYDRSTVIDGYNKVINLLIKTKRIKHTNIFTRLWEITSDYWKAG